MVVANKTTRWWIAAAVAAILLVGLGVAVLPGLLNRGDAAQQKAAPLASPAAGAERDPSVATVTAEEAVLRPIQRTVPFVGTFAGFDEVTVMAEVTGRVAEVCHDVGDIVRPGETLLKIDPTDYQLAAEETRRALELEATRIGLPIPPEKDFTPEKILGAEKVSGTVSGREP